MKDAGFPYLIDNLLNNILLLRALRKSSLI